MKTMEIKYQLVPPGNHRENNAERAILTFKNHFIAVLYSIDKDFHLQLWDILIQQSKISLNLIRHSILHSHQSAYMHIFLGFNYNRTPLSSPGTRIVIHNRPNDRSPWEPHGESG